MAQATVVLISTGGTIATRQLRTGEGAVPALSGRDLARLLPELPVRVEVEEVCNKPGSWLTLEDLNALRRAVEGHLAREEVVGVVVTHGTDTLEETAYYLEIAVEGPKPIVLTGSMRTASQPGYDGPANLAAAVRTAAAPEARGWGALVVLNETIHDARRATKGHGHRPDAFVSPEGGPVGAVYGPQVRFFGPPPPRRTIPHRTLAGRVGLFKAALGLEPDPLLTFEGEGVVLEGMGSGRLPPPWLAAARRLLERGVRVGVVTRCPAGPLYDEYGYEGAVASLRRAGIWLADGLNGPKARLHLLAALSAEREGDGPAERWLF